MPILQTARLILRPLQLTDAATVRRLAGAREIADTTLLIPHPYPDGAADVWIRATHDAARQGRGHTFAIVRRDDALLVGAANLTVAREYERAELGYWIGSSYWGAGYATEAARRAVQFGFEELELHRIHATALTRNAASTNVMRKIGMRHEGRQREHVRKWGRYEDTDLYGILRADWDAMTMHV